MTTQGNDPATKADLVSLDLKIDRLDKKIDASVQRLDQKSDVSLERLDQKIDVSVERLDQKIDTSVRRLAKAIVETQAEVREVKSTLTGLATKDDVSRILGAIDAFAGKAQNYDRAAALHGQALSEVRAQVKDHERRIKKIESARH